MSKQGSGDCGCGGGHPFDVELSTELGDVGEPSIPDLEAALSALLSEEDIDLSVADLEAALAVDEDLPATLDEGDLPTISSVLALAERYPGLKITFSF